MNSLRARLIALLAALVAAPGIVWHHSAIAAAPDHAQHGRLHGDGFGGPDHPADRLPAGPSVRGACQDLSLTPDAARTKALASPLCLSSIAALGQPQSLVRAGDVCHISASPRLHLLQCVWRL
jgi:hypothetical protein